MVECPIRSSPRPFRQTRVAKSWRRSWNRKSPRPRARSSSASRRERCSAWSASAFDSRLDLHFGQIHRYPPPRFARPPHTGSRPVGTSAGTPRFGRRVGARRNRRRARGAADDGLHVAGPRARVRPGHALPGSVRLCARIRSSRAVHADLRRDGDCLRGRERVSAALDRQQRLLPRRDGGARLALRDGSRLPSHRRVRRHGGGRAPALQGGLQLGRDTWVRRHAVLRRGRRRGPRRVLQSLRPGIRLVRPTRLARPRAGDAESPA